MKTNHFFVVLFTTLLLSNNAFAKEKEKYVNFFDSAETEKSCEGQASFLQGPIWSGSPTYPDKPVGGLKFVKSGDEISVVKSDGTVFKGLSGEYKKKRRFGEKNDGVRIELGRRAFADIYIDDNGKCEIRVTTDKYCPNIEYKFVEGKNGANNIVYVNRNNTIYRIEDTSGYATFYQYASYLKTKKTEITSDESKKLKDIFEKILFSVEDEGIRSTLGRYRNSLSGDALRDLDLSEIGKLLSKADVETKFPITNEREKDTDRDSLMSYLSDPSERNCKDAGSEENNDLDTKNVDSYYAADVEEDKKRRDRAQERRDRRKGKR